MRTFVVKFTDIYQKEFTGRIKVLGTVLAEAPVSGFFLRRRQNEIIEKVWTEVRQQYRVVGYKSVSIEERRLTLDEYNSGKVSYR